MDASANLTLNTEVFDNWAIYPLIKESTKDNEALQRATKPSVLGKRSLDEGIQHDVLRHACLHDHRYRDKPLIMTYAAVDARKRPIL